MTSVDRVGAQAHSGSTTSSDGAIRLPARKTRAGSGPSCGTLEPGGWWRVRPPACRSVKRAGHCSARVRRGSSPGWSTPSTTTRSGPRFGWTPRWTTPRFRCCCSTGWQDLFIEQTLAQYARLRGRGVPVAVTIGPWNHSHMLRKGAPTVLRESLAWLDTHLAGNRGASRSPVRIHVNHKGWIDLEDWPPSMPEQVRYLQPGGRLGDAVPPDTAPSSTFTYDPADPTPTIGGRLLSPEGGYRNDTKLAERADVLSFTSDALAQDTYVVGNPVIELSHSCDNPHNDLFVRVSEVDAKGRSRNVSDGYRRGTTDSGSVTHRTRCGRTPVPRRVPHQGAGRRWLASALRAQSRYRRATDHRQSAATGHAHRAPRRRRVAPAAACRPVPALIVGRQLFGAGFAKSAWPLIFGVTLVAWMPAGSVTRATATFTSPIERWAMARFRS